MFGLTGNFGIGIQFTNELKKELGQMRQSL